MPTYDYRCTKCGDTFAIEQSIHDRPLTRCKKCRGKLEKLLPRTLNLIFKGSGFYVTDYKKSGDTSGKGGGEKRESEAGSNGHKTDTPGPKAAGAKCKDVKG